LADLRAAAALYDRAIPLYEQAAGTDDTSHVVQRVQAYTKKAALLAALGEMQDALALLDQAITLCQEVVKEHGQGPVAADLAAAWLRKAELLNVQGESAAAVALCDQAIELFDQLIQDAGRIDLGQDLSQALTARAEAAGVAPEQNALMACQRTVALWEQLVYHEGRTELRDVLASAYLAKAALLKTTRHTSTVLKLCEAGIDLYRKLLVQRPELEGPLAAAYVQLADVYADILGDCAGAESRYEQGIPLLEKRALREGDFSLGRTLVNAYLHRAFVRRTLAKPGEAAADCNAARSLCETLIQQGRLAFLRLLPSCDLQKAQALDARKNPESAVPLYERACQLAERLAAESSTPAVLASCGSICGTTAIAWSARRWFREALALCDRAINVAEELVDGRGLKQYRPLLAHAYFQKACVVGLQRDRLRRGPWRLVRGLWHALTGNRPQPWSAAVALCERCIGLYRDLIAEGQRRFVGELARSSAYRARILIVLGKGADADLEQAVATLKTEVAAGRVGLNAYLQDCNKFLNIRRHLRRFRPITAPPEL
jgi:tetratricopeptide (TPR) repeat protein